MVAFSLHDQVLNTVLVTLNSCQMQWGVPININSIPINSIFKQSYNFFFLRSLFNILFFLLYIIAINVYFFDLFWGLLLDWNLFVNKHFAY